MNKIILFIIPIILPFFCMAQKTDTIFYTSQWKPTDIKDSTVFYRVVKYDKNGKPVGKVHDYYQTGEMQWEGELLSVEPEIIQGKALWYFQNGKKSQECTYKEGKLIGKLHQWDEKGNLEGVQYYVDGENIAKTIDEKKLFEFDKDTISPSLLYFKKNLNLGLETDFETALLLDDWADFLTEKNDDQNAIKFYLLAARLKRKLKKELSMAYTFTCLSYSYSNTNEPIKAKEFLELAMKIQQKELGIGSPEYVNNAERLKKIEAEIQKMNKFQQDGDWMTLRQKSVEYAQNGKYSEAIECCKQAIKATGKQFGKTDNNYVESLNYLAFLYQTLNRYDEAKALFAQSLEIRGKSPGKNSSLYAVSLYNLGKLYQLAGKYSDAEKLLIQSKDIIEKCLGQNNSDFGFSLCNLADLYFTMGRYTEAEPLYIRNKEIQEKVFGKNHLAYAQSIFLLANVYQIKGDYVKALPFFKEYADIYKKLYGDESPFYGLALGTLASLHMSMLNYRESESLYIRAAEINKKAFGASHIYYATAINNLAILYQNMGVFNKADSMFHVVLKIKEKVLGKENSDYLNCLNDLGFLYKKEGMYDLAEPIFEEVLKTRIKVLGKTHQESINSLVNLAEIKWRLVKYSDAEALCKESIGLIDNLFGKESINKAPSLTLLGNLRSETSDFSESESLFNEALSIIERNYGKDNIYMMSPLIGLANNYFRAGDYGNTEKVYFRCKELIERKSGKNNYQYASVLNNIANFYERVGNLEKSEAMFVESSEIIKTVLGAEHPEYALTINNLAGVYESLKKLKEAKILYLKSCSIFKKNPGENSLKYATSLNNLSSLYSKEHDNKKADSLCVIASGIYKKILGDNNPEYALLLNNQARLKEALGNKEEAESLYIQSMKIYRKTQGEFHPALATTLHNLGLLYEFEGKMNKAEPIYIQANTNLNNQIRQNFSFMSESEKELFVSRVDAYFEIYSSFAFRYKNTKPEFVGLIYNNELAHKGMILQSSIALRNAISQSGDSILIATALQLNKTKVLLSTANSKSLEKPEIDSLEIVANDLEKELLRKGQNLPEIQKFAELGRTSWKDVQDALLPNEAAIEFTSFDYRNAKEWTDSTYYCALLIRKEFSTPKMIYLCNENQLQKFIHFANGSPATIDYLYKLDGNYGEGNSIEYSLYQLIWQPIDNLLKGIKKVYIAPSGLLNKISFAAIATPEKEYLSDAYIVQTVSSTASLIQKTGMLLPKRGNKASVYGGIRYSADSEVITQQSRKYKRNATGNYLSRSILSADSATRGEVWGYLAGTLSEGQGINDLLNTWGINSTFLSGTVANEESFKSLSGKASPEIIHIATHGFFFPEPEKSTKQDVLLGNQSNMISENPLLRSGLLFAGANISWRKDSLPDDVEDGILTAQEISQMYLPNTKLVVLSACETGLGDIKGNEGVFGLRRAFKMAGVEYLIMSLWQVPDEQTSELMQAFYKEWLSGKSVDEAFDSAQSILKLKYHDHPYNWAAFVMVH